MLRSAPSGRKSAFFIVLFCHMLSLSEIQEQLCGLENVTRGYLNIGVRDQWVEFQFWVNYLFNTHSSRATSVLCHMHISRH